MFRAGLAIAIACCVMVLPAAAGYIFFYQLHDDWAVLCWRDQASEIKSCRMNAPPAGATGGTRRNELIVHEYAPERFQIVVQLNEPASEDHPLFLKVAPEGTLHQTRIVDRLARWFDAEAAAIMAEMARGTDLTYRFHSAGDEALPRDTHIRLGSYPEALKVYRQEIRRHGLLKGDGGK